MRSGKCKTLTERAAQVSKKDQDERFCLVRRLVRSMSNEVKLSGVEEQLWKDALNGWKHDVAARRRRYSETLAEF